MWPTPRPSKAVLGRNPRPALWQLDQKASRYGVLPSSLPEWAWLHEGMKSDLDGAVMMYGLWIEARLSEIKPGRTPKPKHTLGELLRTAPRSRSAGGYKPVTDKKTGRQYTDPRAAFDLLRGKAGIGLIHNIVPAAKNVPGPAETGPNESCPFARRSLPSGKRRAI